MKKVKVHFKSVVKVALLFQSPKYNSNLDLTNIKKVGSFYSFSYTYLHHFFQTDNKEFQ